MPKVFINTIVGAAEHLSQIKLLQVLEELDLGLDGIEVRGELFAEDETKRIQEFKAIRSIAEKNNWELHISYPFELFDKEGLREEAKEALSEIEEQNIVSAKFNTGHLDGLSKTSAKDIHRLFEGAPREIRIENGQEVENGTLRYVTKALEQVQSNQLPIGFTFDMGNWSIMNEDPQVAFDSTNASISAFHLKNVNQAGEAVLVDDGIIEWRNFTGLDIPYIIEYPIKRNEIKNEVIKLKEALF